MNMMGKPSFFHVDMACDVVEQLITCDEVERALLLLNNFPSWYREYPTERMKEIRQSLHQALFTPFDYAKADREAAASHVPPDYWPARGEILLETVREVNANGQVPHIMELGPGTSWLSYGLRAKECKFTYEFQSLDHIGTSASEDGPNILVAYELIEHLSNELELYQAYLKFGKKAQKCFFSTPLHTYAGGMPSWRGQALGHLRAYSPKEFREAVQGMFTEFTFDKHYSFNDGTQVVVGTRV